MRTHGLRGRSSPMNNATEEQKASILRLRDQLEAEGVGLMSVEYTPYIGPGCAAERGAITVCDDGKITAFVFPDGRIGY